MLHKLEELNLEPQETPEWVIEKIPQLFEEDKKKLVDAAISAEVMAKHHDKERPIHVGCSVLALGEKLEIDNPIIYTGANFKLKPGMLAYPERKCAEMVAFEGILGLRDVENEGVDRVRSDLRLIVAIVTVSESPNTRETDTIDHDVLLPCKQYQTNYEFLLQKGILNEKTIIYNARTKNGVPEKL